MPERKRTSTKVLKPTTLGSRIHDKRIEAGLTQAEFAKEVATVERAMGLDPKKSSRSSFAQYERDASSPPLTKLQAMAKVFNCTPEFLAFGVKPAGEEDAGQPVMVSEYAFGASPTDRILVDRWGYPRSWLTQEVNAHRPEDLIVYKVQYPQVVGFEHNDRVIVDTGATKVSPPGDFLYWDGVGPALAHISISAGAGARKPTARVKTKDDTFEIEVDKLKVIGRVLVAVKGR